MAIVVTNINFDNNEWRIVERYDSPNSPYYVIEKKGKNAMDQISWEHIDTIFPCVWSDVVVNKEAGSFLYLVLKKLSDDIKIYRKD